MRLGVVSALLAGCYSPAAPTQVACADNGACPSGQACDRATNRCTSEPIPDAMIDAIPDAMIDAMGDAMAQNPSGCADGEREAFASITTYPDIAGCAAAWTGDLSLRAARTSGPCGDDTGACAAPADACASGWHVCAANGDPAELAAIPQAECVAAATGRFVAASSHCTNNMDVCEYAGPLPCFDAGWCSEPVCCGMGCTGSPGCADGVWASGTVTTRNNGGGCNAFPATEADGVLCCRD